MAVTKYQVLYRLMNDALGTPITNSISADYEPLFEFYCDPDHRIFSPDPMTQNEEMEKQQAIITESNNAANIKNDMLFVFNGTKKFLHKKWVNEQVGYVVRDWKSIRTRVADRDKWNKEFYTLNAKTPEDGGLVVAPSSTFSYTYRSYSVMDGNYIGTDLDSMFVESTIYQLKDEDWRTHTTPTRVDSDYYNENNKVATGPIFVDVPETEIKKHRVSHYSYYSNPKGVHYSSPYYNHCYGSISHSASDIQTIQIPGHYEDSANAPYAVKDQYKRVESSPWIINCTTASLEAALTKARILIDMIGIENVKIIKIVPFDQYIKIK